MKFSNLSSASRSMLAALCASVGSGLSTYQLGKAVTPQLDPQAAASVLMDLRAKGLVYSHQKPAGQSYCMWHASDFGQAVFNGRPADVTEVPEPVATAATGPDNTVRHYVIYPGVLSFKGTERSVLEQIKQLAESAPGTTYTAYVELATARLPVPAAQITLL